ncbi:MAG: HEAT repeat domain-containing protein, partial [Actinomycetota bacterium]|nr:HEAT repeat domain-containing protein [Actinomycetota bacterium]
AFEDPDPVARELALGALLRIGALTDDDLRAALGDGVPSVRRRAALIDLGVTSSDALVREACTAALGAIGDPRGLATILHGCTDKPAVRRRAVLALAPFDGAEVDAALQAALSDRDWQVRQAAEDVLGASNAEDIFSPNSRTNRTGP